MSITIRAVSFVELERQLTTLVELLRETVNGGSSMGFHPPMTCDESRNYYQELTLDQG